MGCAPPQSCQSRGLNTESIGTEAAVGGKMIFKTNKQKEEEEGKMGKQEKLVSNPTNRADTGGGR